MQTEETGETRVRIYCLNFDVSQCIQIKNKFRLEEEGILIILLWDLTSCCSSILHKIS